MIIISLKNLIESMPTLNSLAQENLPVGVSFRIAQVAALCADRLKTFNETRNALIRKYGKNQDNGSASIEPGSENESLFIADLNEILDAADDITIDITKIDIDMLGNINLQPAIFVPLMWLFEENQEAQ